MLMDTTTCITVARNMVIEKLDDCLTKLVLLNIYNIYW